MWQAGPLPDGAGAASRVRFRIIPTGVMIKIASEEPIRRF
jgi:hypothetical protein